MTPEADKLELSISCNEWTEVSEARPGRGLCAALLENLDLPEPSRIYFGNGFCEKRVPALKELERAWNCAAGKGLAFTLQTPPVTDCGLKALRPLLDWLGARDVRSEVAVNDIGVLALIGREYPGFSIVLGRLMSRMKSMPEFAGIWPWNGEIGGTVFTGGKKTKLSGEQMYALRNSSFSVALYRKFLRESRVSLVEFEVLPQGMQLPEKRTGLKIGIHYPWVYITSGRICEMGGMHLHREDKFIPGGRCAKECRGYGSRWTAPRPSMAKSMIQIGNAAFMLCGLDAKSLSDYLAVNRADRLILSPFGPF